MPKQSEERSSYFNEDLMYTTVERFVLFYLPNRAKINMARYETVYKTENELSPLERRHVVTEFTARAMLDRPLEKGGVQTRSRFPFTDQEKKERQAIEKYFDEKGYFRTNKETGTKERVFPVQVPVPDARFLELEELVKKYSMPVKPEEKREIANKLYPLILDLEIEHRIDGDFRIEPVKNKQLSELNERLADLERRVTIANDLAQRFWKQWHKYKRTLPKGTQDLLTE